MEEQISSQVECSIEPSLNGGTYHSNSFTMNGSLDHRAYQNGVHLSCEICGRATSRQGKPYTARTLRMHKAKAHQGDLETDLTVAQSRSHLFSCDICGATTGRRGQLFRNMDDVLQHQRLKHKKIIPIPKSSQETNGPSESTTEYSVVKFCPQCGCNVQAVGAALNARNA